jgi:polysaccharide export outer membrane protein
MGEDLISKWTRAVIFLIAMAFVPLDGAWAQEPSLEYRLGPGDKVKVTVFGEEDLSGEYELGSLGVIAMPLIGAVRGATRTEKELEEAIRAYPR